MAPQELPVHQTVYDRITVIALRAEAEANREYAKHQPIILKMMGYGSENHRVYHQTMADAWDRMADQIEQQIRNSERTSNGNSDLQAQVQQGEGEEEPR